MIQLWPGHAKGSSNKGPFSRQDIVGQTKDMLNGQSLGLHWVPCVPC